MTPQQSLHHRFEALQNHDYSAVYQSYHQDSPLHHQFADSATYAAFAEQQLSDLILTSWRCLAERTLSTDQVECLLQIDFELAEEPHRLYELALLIRSDGQWYYHSAQKLPAEDLRGCEDDIGFEHFENNSEKIRY